MVGEPRVDGPWLRVSSWRRRVGGSVSRYWQNKEHKRSVDPAQSAWIASMTNAVPFTECGFLYKVYRGRSSTYLC